MQSRKERGRNREVLGILSRQPVWLFESVKHLFEYPTKSTRTRRNAQISWVTVYHNIYVKSGHKFVTELDVTEQQVSTEAVMEPDVMELVGRHDLVGCDSRDVIISMA